VKDQNRRPGKRPGDHRKNHREDRAKSRPKGASSTGREARIAQLRGSIAGVDSRILGLLRRRMELAADVGRIKADLDMPIVVKDVEDRVLGRARRHAKECGVSRDVMDEIFEAILRGSVERQHRIGVAARARRGGRVLIVGGDGNMGRWFTAFLRLVGHRVGAVDPRWAPVRRGPGRFASLDQVRDLDAYDFILVAAPLAPTPEVMAEIVERRPRRAVVVEIASIKTPLRSVLADARRNGVTTLSLHPMFGPGKSPYEPLRFVLAVRGDREGDGEGGREGDREHELRMTHDLLRHPYTVVVPVAFDEHDRLMGWLLGLAHMNGILFGAALARSGIDSSKLGACASTTFARQAATTMSILSEDPALYLDIQRLNPHRAEVYAATREALDEIVRLVDAGDLERFRAAFEDVRSFVGGM